MADAVIVTFPVLFGVVYETPATPDEFVLALVPPGKATIRSIVSEVNGDTRDHDSEIDRSTFTFKRLLQKRVRMHRSDCSPT